MPRAGKPPILLIGLLILVNLAAGGGYALSHQRSGTRATAASAAGAVPSRAAVRSLLDRRSRAVLAHDRAAFLGTVDPAGVAFRAAQGVLFDNLAGLPLADWRETPAGDGPVAAGEAGWTAHLEMSYRLAGFDRRDVTRSEYLTFARTGRLGWVISGDGSPHGLHDDPEIWSGGRVTVVAGRYSLVLANGDQAPGDPQDIAGRLDAAVAAVSGVVGDQWSRRVVALVPATEQQAQSLVGASRNLSDIAAVATVTGGPDGPGTGEDRVIIAPDAFGRLSAIGRHVVLTHEVTHVATGAATDTRTPIWLIEGLADYVGYKGTGVPVRSAAAELAAGLRAGHLPDHLPDRNDFAGQGTALSATYEQAWLACRMVAERYGESALVRLYRAARSGLDTALRSVLHLDPASFTAMWRAYLRAQLAR